MPLNTLLRPITEEDLKIARRIAQRLVSTADVDDVVQETAIELHKHTKPFEIPPGSDPLRARKGILYAFVRRQVVSLHRKRKRSPVRLTGNADGQIHEGSRGAVPSAEEHILQRHDRTLFYQALAEIAPEQQAIIRSVLDGTLCTEIARACGLPPGTVCSRLLFGKQAIVARIHLWQEEERWKARRRADRG